MPNVACKLEWTELMWFRIAGMEQDPVGTSGKAFEICEKIMDRLVEKGRKAGRKLKEAYENATRLRRSAPEVAITRRQLRMREVWTVVRNRWPQAEQEGARK